ncbi:uncharacterized protein LOC131662928 [Phymastichus coffea]|uniref:uncharacterized protein LOC131662928 n=1 Tax=Phymastichus coffea TaxID=108790 RepID=UPI00273AF415|nr:uncharacterized protein LOC131662928 [Phymastichus coffea]XP_058788915.1 uncharacterized protein LOC131662928 [Phymastichus coffea]
MGLLSMLSIVFFALFAVITVTQSWKIDDSTWLLKFKGLSKDSKILLGKGIDDNQVVFIECLHIKSANCTIYTRNQDKCNVIIDKKHPSDTSVLSVTQVTGNKVIVESDRKDQNNVITLIDTDRCEVMKHLQLNKTNLVKIIFENGIDMITSTNKRIRFDLNGNPTYERPKVFRLPEGDVVKLAPVSRRWRSKGFFASISNDTQLKMNLILDDGTLYKELLEIRTYQLIAEDQSKQFLTVCWDDDTLDNDKIKCAQYDELANEKFKKELEHPSSEKLFALRNLRNGGFVRFAYNKNLTKIRATVAYLDREPEQSIYNINAGTNEILLADFYEKDGTFIVAYIDKDDTAPDVKGFVLQKYKLPGSLGQQG